MNQSEPSPIFYDLGVSKYTLGLVEYLSVKSGCSEGGIIGDVATFRLRHSFKISVNLDQWFPTDGPRTSSGP